MKHRFKDFFRIGNHNLSERQVYTHFLLSRGVANSTESYDTEKNIYLFIVNGKIKIIEKLKICRSISLFSIYCFSSKANLYQECVCVFIHSSKLSWKQNSLN